MTSSRRGWNGSSARCADGVEACSSSPTIDAFVVPKLRLRSRQDLGAVLAKLELDLVDPRLQQGLLASGEPVTIGAIVHEAFIQVDETTLLFQPFPSLSEERLSVFRVDRPFYFVLVERRTGLVLLMGQMTDPTA